MRINLRHMLGSLYPLGIYTVQDIVSEIGWSHFSLRRVCRGMLRELEAGFEETDSKTGGYFGYRWAQSITQGTDLSLPTRDTFTYELAQLVEPSHPHLAHRLYLLDMVCIEGKEIKPFIDGVSMWLPMFPSLES